MRAAMRAAGATHHLISTVDDIAWLLNLRGADVAYNPVFLGHVLLDASGATLFVGAGKIDAALARTLAADGVAVAPYEAIDAALAALPTEARLLVDPRRNVDREAENQRAEARSPEVPCRARPTRSYTSRPRRPRRAPSRTRPDGKCFRNGSTPHAPCAPCRRTRPIPPAGVP
jgi:hypothetical protein